MIKKIIGIMVLMTAAVCGSERTFSLIKPDGVASSQIGAIENHLEKGGLKIVASKMKRLTREEVEVLYSHAKEKPYFNKLVNFMISGPVIVQVLEGEDAVKLNRKLMGATDPLKAEPGTIRALFGKNVQDNVIHGSDSLDNAKKEIALFFSEEEIVR